MNLPLPTPTSLHSSEVQKLHDILCDCGVHRLWKNPRLRVLKVYLESCADHEDIHECLGQGIFKYLVTQAKPQRSWLQEIDIVDDILFWLLENANGNDLKQALRMTTQQVNTNTIMKVSFNHAHPSFARDHDEFHKLTTLMTIEGFPVDLHLVPEYEIQQLTCYELLHHRHRDTQILQKMREYINQSAEQTFAQEMASRLGKKGVMPKAKTTCSQKFLDLTNWDRIRMMRFYRFISSEGEK